jgi:hypothetical protein
VWIFSPAFSVNPTIPRKSLAYPSQFLNSKTPFLVFEEKKSPPQPGLGEGVTALFLKSAVPLCSTLSRASF